MILEVGPNWEIQPELVRKIRLDLYANITGEVHYRIELSEKQATMVKVINDPFGVYSPSLIQVRCIYPSAKENRVESVALDLADVWGDGEPDTPMDLYVEPPMSQQDVEDYIRSGVEQVTYHGPEGLHAGLRGGVPVGAGLYEQINATADTAHLSEANATPIAPSSTTYNAMQQGANVYLGTAGEDMQVDF